MSCRLWRKTAHSDEIRVSPRTIQELLLREQLPFCMAETIKAPCGAFFVSELSSAQSQKSSRAVFTTFSTVKPNTLKSSSAGADSPKVFMPTIFPSSPTYLYQ